MLPHSLFTLPAGWDTEAKSTTLKKEKTYTLLQIEYKSYEQRRVQTNCPQMDSAPNCSLMSEVLPLCNGTAQASVSLMSSKWSLGGTTVHKP